MDTFLNIRKYKLILGKVSLILFIFLFFLFFMKINTEAYEHAKVCSSSSDLLIYQYEMTADYRCCPRTFSISGRTKSDNGKCESVEQVTLSLNEDKISKSLLRGYYGLCKYTPSQGDMKSYIRKSDDPSNACTNIDDAIFSDYGYYPHCSNNKCQDQFTFTSGIGDEHVVLCYDPGENFCWNLIYDITKFRCTNWDKNKYCCAGYDTADDPSCNDNKFCTGGCPASTDGDGDGGSSEVPTLTCEEICSGEEKGSDNYNYCISCICEGEPSGTVTTGNVWTELGCIDATQNGIIISVMRIFVGVVTGLAIIRFIQAGFMLNTDDPEKIKEGKSIAVSAVVAIAFGALLIVIMNFIGINVLGIGKIIS
jgi:hypothetical protein